MRAAVVFLAFVVASSVVGLCAKPAAAFVCTRTSSTGPSLAWADRSVVLRPHGEPGAEVSLAEIVGALQFAAAQWSSVSCSDLVLEVGPLTEENRVGFDWGAGADDPVNQNIVAFREGAPTADEDAWLHPIGAIAITTVTFVRSTGRIVDADVEMNDASFTFSACEPDEPGCVVQHDLKNTLTHELGHVVGLDHPPRNQPGATEATMFASAALGDLNKRDLSDDDIAGVCTIYPAGAPTGECYGVDVVEAPEMSVRQSGCAAAGGSGDGAMWALLCALGLLRARRGRK